MVGGHNMKAELISIGTELLLGQILNTNVQYLAQECAALGIDLYFQTVVGDNAQRLQEAFTQASQRADLIIATGGLGPTQDDLTKDVLARMLGRKLVIHEPSLDKIVARFRERKMPMVESNKRQALILEGSEPLPNDTGLAVGVAVEAGNTRFMLLPGPPNEMKPMFETYGRAWLQKQMPDAMPLYSRMLKFAGIGESNLENLLLDLIDAQQDPTIAPYAKPGEVTIRLTTRAPNQNEAERKMAATLEEIRRRAGNHLYAMEDISLEEAVVAELIRSGRTLSVAESCTGGLVGDLITSVAGSSQAFRGGFLVYSNAMKHQLLGIPMELLEGEGAKGAVSPETAGEMAERTLERTGTDMALSLTGVAGPDPVEGKPVGLVYIGLAERGKPTDVFETRHFGTRDLIKLNAAKRALYHVWSRLTGK